jgi:putative exporter of polyketide antibiotics
VFSGVGHNKVALTSMVLTADPTGTSGAVRVGIVATVKANSATGDCHTGAGFTSLGEQFKVNVVTGTTLNLTWPSPLVWTASADADDFWCVNVVVLGGPAGYALHVAAYGFTP